MAISNLSLTALMTASGHSGAGSPNMYTINKNSATPVSMSQFAVSAFSNPTDNTGGYCFGDGTSYTFFINGTSIGNKFKTHIASVAGKVVWTADDGGLGMLISDYGIDTNGDQTYAFDNSGLGDGNVTVSYKVVDGFNTNATDYNVFKSDTFVVYDQCFLAGTNIIMSDGTYKFIEDIKVGDYILSYDFTNAIFVPSVVEKIFNHKSSEYCVINNKLMVTPNHKLWVNDILSLVSNIKRGDFLRNDRFEKVYVFDIQKIVPDSKFNTYNLRIKDTHNYLAEGLLVHNKCPFVYSSYNGVETCHGTILTNFEGYTNRNKDMVVIEIPFDKIIIREIEQESSYFSRVWMNHIELSKDFILNQGDEIIFDVKNKNEITILFATGYYMNTE